MKKVIVGALAGALVIALALLGFWALGGQESGQALGSADLEVSQAASGEPLHASPGSVTVDVWPSELPEGKRGTISVRVRRGWSPYLARVWIRDADGYTDRGLMFGYKQFGVRCFDDDGKIHVYVSPVGYPMQPKTVDCKPVESTEMEIQPNIQLGSGSCGQGFPDSFVLAFGTEDVLSFSETNTLPDGTVVTIGMEALQELSGSGEFLLVRDDAGNPVDYLFELTELNQVLSPFPALGPDAILSSSLAPGGLAGGIMVLSDSDGDTIVDQGELGGDFEALVTVTDDVILFEGVLSTSVTGTWDFSCPDQTISLYAFGDMPLPGVGGVLELPVGSSDAPASAAEGSGSSAPPYALLAGATAAALALAAGGWYARRRWLG